MKTLGFFGGTFDPIHFGHLSLAIQLLETCHLDEIVFCPAFCSPSKSQSPPVANPEHRFAMVQLAVKDFPHFRVTPIEIERGGISYTVETLRALKSDREKFRLLLSEEAAADFESWKEPQEILRLAPPLVGTRSNSPSLKEPFSRFAIPTKIMEISSTDIRKRLKEKLCCAHLLPRKTLDYIQKHHLYSS